MTGLVGRFASREGVSSRFFAVSVMFMLSVMTVMVFAPLEAAPAQASASTATMTSVDQNGDTLNVTSYVYTALYDSAGNAVAAGFTAATLATAAGSGYVLHAYGFASCAFSNWSGGRSSDPMSFTASGGALSFTAVYNCSNIATRTTTTTSVTTTTKTTTATTTTVSRVGGAAGTITIYDHRVPQANWSPCFAAVCSAGTRPGVTMWVALYDSTGAVVASGFANENGYTFTGLDPSSTYYVYPADCDLCHTSTHDVLFNHWGDGSTTRPLGVTATGTSLDAWYICTNTCGGV